MPQSKIYEIIEESDIIGDHKIWKDEFLALAKESAAIRDESYGKRRAPVILKRSRSADDFDLVKTRSLDRLYSDPDVSESQFQREKAKSVRRSQENVLQS